MKQLRTESSLQNVGAILLHSIVDRVLLRSHTNRSVVQVGLMSTVSRSQVQNDKCWCHVRLQCTRREWNGHKRSSMRSARPAQAKQATEMCEQDRPISKGVPTPAVKDATRRDANEPVDEAKKILGAQHSLVCWTISDLTDLTQYPDENFMREIPHATQGFSGSSAARRAVPRTQTASGMEVSSLRNRHSSSTFSPTATGHCTRRIARAALRGQDEKFGPRSKFVNAGRHLPLQR